MDNDSKFYQYVEFLETKYALDKKSMSYDAWRMLLSICEQRSAGGVKWPGRVLDCGCGTGAMLKHLLDHGVHIGEYHGIDIHSGLLSQAGKYVVAGKFSGMAGTTEFHALSVYNLSRAPHSTDARCAEAFQQQFDLVCGLSLAEHVEIDRMLANIRNVLKTDGLLFLPINYAGETIFEPTSDCELERLLIGNFNAMSIGGQVYEGQVGGNAYCGRVLHEALIRNGFDVLVFAPEDWVIAPRSLRPHYDPGVEKFLEMVVDEVARTNRECLSASGWRAANPNVELSNAIITDWAGLRRKQMAEGQLLFRCVQAGALAQKKEQPLIMEALEIDQHDCV